MSEGKTEGKMVLAASPSRSSSDPGKVWTVGSEVTIRIKSRGSELYSIVDASKFGVVHGCNNDALRKEILSLHPGVGSRARVVQLNRFYQPQIKELLRAKGLDRVPVSAAPADEIAEAHTDIIAGGTQLRYDTTMIAPLHELNNNTWDALTNDGRVEIVGLNEVDTRHWFMDNNITIVDDGHDGAAKDDEDSDQWINLPLELTTKFDASHLFRLAEASVRIVNEDGKFEHYMATRFDLTGCERLAYLYKSQIDALRKLPFSVGEAKSSTPMVTFICPESELDDVPHRTPIRKMIEAGTAKIVAIGEEDGEAWFRYNVVGARHSTIEEVCGFELEPDQMTQTQFAECLDRSVSDTQDDTSGVSDRSMQIKLPIAHLKRMDIGQLWQGGSQVSFTIVGGGTPHAPHLNSDSKLEAKSGDDSKLEASQEPKARVVWMTDASMFGVANGCQTRQRKEILEARKQEQKMDSRLGIHRVRKLNDIYLLQLQSLIAVKKIQLARATKSEREYKYPRFDIRYCQDETNRGIHPASNGVPHGSAAAHQADAGVSIEQLKFDTPMILPNSDLGSVDKDLAILIGLDKKDAQQWVRDNVIGVHRDALHFCTGKRMDNFVELSESNPEEFARLLDEAYVEWEAEVRAMEKKRRDREPDAMESEFTDSDDDDDADVDAATSSGVKRRK